MCRIKIIWKTTSEAETIHCLLENMCTTYESNGHTLVENGCAFEDVESQFTLMYIDYSY